MPLLALDGARVGRKGTKEPGQRWAMPARSFHGDACDVCAPTSGSVLCDLALLTFVCCLGRVFPLLLVTLCIRVNYCEVKEQSGQAWVTACLHIDPSALGASVSEAPG